MASDIADWSALPPPLLSLISGRLDDNADYVRFRAVCSFWRLSSPARALPWLALPMPTSSDTCSFYRVADRGVHLEELEATAGSCCGGSTLGWLVIINRSFDLFLLNPLTGRRIPLPPLDSNYRYQGVLYHDIIDVVSVLVLSSDPTLPGCIALSIFRKTVLACSRIGDNSWITLPDLGFLCYPADLAYLNGEFYVVDYRFNLYVCSMDPPVTVRPCLNMTGLFTSERRRGRQPTVMGIYLVESDGMLLLAVKMRNSKIASGTSTPIREIDFEVYRLEETMGAWRWIELDNLGDNILFLGEGHSSSLFTGGLPERFRANSIYFNNYWNRLPRPSRTVFPTVYGVFDYGDGSMQRVEICRDRGPPRRSSWITLSFATNGA